jgi:hypothetical protein
MFDKTYKQLQEGWKIVENRLEGGLSDNMTLSDIAKKHVGNSSSKAYTMAFYLLKNELKKGIKVEMEHTNDSEIAKGIAKDHLYEDPDYYTKLEKCQIDESEEKTIHKVCYMVTLDKESQNKLHELSKQFDIKADEIVPKDEYHATIRFMKTNKDLEPFKDWLHSQELPTISVEGVKLDKMNDAFVIKLEGEGIQEWFDKVNEWLVENGYPKSDYDTFKPHISFSYQTHEDFEIPK